MEEKNGADDVNVGENDVNSETETDAVGPSSAKKRRTEAEPAAASKVYVVNRLEYDYRCDPNGPMDTRTVCAFSTERGALLFATDRSSEQWRDLLDYDELMRVFAVHEGYGDLDEECQARVKPFLSRANIRKTAPGTGRPFIDFESLATPALRAMFEYFAGCLEEINDLPSDTIPGMCMWEIVDLELDQYPSDPWE